MTKAEQIFEKHIGLNTELGYLPYKKENIIDAINEALTIPVVVGQSEQLVCESCKEKFTAIDKWNFHCQDCQPCKPLGAN